MRARKATAPSVCSMAYLSFLPSVAFVALLHDHARTVMLHYLIENCRIHPLLTGDWCASIDINQGADRSDGSSLVTGSRPQPHARRHTAPGLTVWYGAFFFQLVIESCPKPLRALAGWVSKAFFCSPVLLHHRKTVVNSEWSALTVRQFLFFCLLLSSVLVFCNKSQRNADKRLYW